MMDVTIHKELRLKSEFPSCSEHFTLEAVGDGEINIFNNGELRRLIRENLPRSPAYFYSPGTGPAIYDFDEATRIDDRRWECERNNKLERELKATQKRLEECEDRQEPIGEPGPNDEVPF